MVRSRIRSSSAEETTLEPTLQTLAESDADMDGRREAGTRTHGESTLALVLDVLTPLLEKTAHSAALGCLLALGGCSADRIDVEGIVRDGRTGEPIAGAQITADDGSSAETDAQGRFALRVPPGERVVASAPHRCTRAARANGRHLTIDLFDFQDENECIAEARIEARPVTAGVFDGLDSGPDAGASAGTREADEWALSTMSHFVRPLDENHPALRSECAQCHSAQGWLAWRSGQGETALDAAAAMDCASCHDGRSLRVFDTSDPIAGVSAEHLGSGALCVSCHRSGVAHGDLFEAAPHAPQGDMLVGRGARSVDAIDTGAHRFIADTCVRCHMNRPEPDEVFFARAGGHTFATRTADGTSPAACAPCHGSAVSPDAIGMRDWNLDGHTASVRDEHETALARVSARLRARIEEQEVRDACGRVAADFIEHDAMLALVDENDTLLGDCDGDGVVDPSLHPTTIAALPRALADAVYDVALLRSDGSAGQHNPTYAFRVLAALDRALR